MKGNNLMIDAPVARFLENYFDKILVITLERAGERQQQVKQHLRGLSFDFFYGTDKQNLSWDQIIQEGVYDDEKAKKFNRYGKGMILGHLACALSHRSVYEYVLEKGYKKVLIFEDDVVPLYENLNKLPLAINELPEDWEMVYFGYAKNEEATPSLKRKQLFYKVLSPLGLIKWTPLMVNNLLPKDYSKHLKNAGFHDLLHAYAVTREACIKLVAAQTPVVFNSDPLISHLIMNGRLKAFITQPQFFIQEQLLDPSHRSFIHHL